MLSEQILYFARAFVNVYPQLKDSGARYVTLFVVARHKGAPPKAMEPEKCREWVWCDWDNLPQQLVDEHFSVPLFD